MKNFITIVCIFSAIALFASCKSVAHGSNSNEIEVWIAPPKQGELPYTYVPFEIPKGTKSFSVTIEYDKEEGKKKVDFGLFDPSFSGSDTDQKGFRGWSGSIRDKIFIAENSATHGYVSGAIPAGKWNAILGAADVGEGLNVKLNIAVNSINPDAKKQFDEENARVFNTAPAENVPNLKTDEYTWYRGDLHTHTVHSDGYWTVKGLLDAADARNLDFISVTDHNTYSHHADIDREAPSHPNLLVLKGEEVTTYGAHINVWGLPLNQWVDFRVAPGDPASGKRINDSANAKNALAGINHPYMQCKGCTYSFGDWNTFGLVEVWNAGWDQADEEALRKWDELVLNYKKLTAIGGSDTHESPSQPSKWGTNTNPGTPTVFVAAKDKSQESILEGLRKGRVYIAKDPKMQIEFTTKSGAMIGDTIEGKESDTIEFTYKAKGFNPHYLLRVISNGQVAKTFVFDSETFEGTYRIYITDNGFTRIEVRDDANNVVALTNPIHWSKIDAETQPSPTPAAE